MSSIETRVPTRRTVVGGIAAGAGVLAISDNSAGLSQDREAWKTFVLVHGAWHGGWCWRRVADRLEGRGHKVFTPTMTGLGERSHLLDAKVNLTTHVTDIVNAIKWEGLGEVVLVGHSYAGSVISVVAEKMEPAIASIVFLDAAMPKDGESPADGAVPRVRQAIDDTLQRGELSIQPPKAAFFRVNEMDRAWVDERLTPHPAGTLTEKIVLSGARGRIPKKTYIRAKGYVAPRFDDLASKLKADLAWRVYEMPCGHDAMIDMPDRLVEIVLEAA